MALEQWEIDLRKQLENKISKPKTWEEELVQQVQPIIPTKKTNKSLIMSLVVLVLCVLIFVVYEVKKTSQNINAPTKEKEVELESEPEKESITEVESDKFNKLSDKVQLMNEKLSLIGMLFNENFVVVRDNHEKTDLSFLNRDWTIDQMPHHITLSESDKEYLKKYVKNQ